jgi:hypothetical protein
MRHSIGRPTAGEEKKKAALAAFLAGATSNRSSGGGLRVGLALAVFLAEFLHATGGVHDLLLAGIERVAGGADFNVQWFHHRGTRSERIPAAAGHCDVGILGMDFRLHFGSFLMEAGFALPKGADYPQAARALQARAAVTGDR